MTTDIFVGGNPVYPDIAVNPDGSNNDITDPTSNQPNVSAPASPIPLDGWPGNGIPIFSDFNKLFRLVTQWIRYFYARTLDTVLTGSFSGSMTEGLVQLPTGYTKDNCVILGGWVKPNSGSYYCLPLNLSEPNGGSYALLSVKIGNATGTTPEYVRIVYYTTGSTPADLDGYSYAIVLRKIA
jgi:hypothetical protein